MGKSSSSAAGRFGRTALVTAALAGGAGLLAAGGGSPARRAQASSPAASTALAAQPATAVTRAGHPLRGLLGYLRSRDGVAQVALFDAATGRTYLVSDGPDTQYTASIVKADILARWLRRYQSKPGTIPASIPYSIQFLMKNMISMSDNAAATSLFYFGGGCRALTRFNTLIPTRDTSVGCQTPTYYGWGNTTTSAADQVAIVRTLAYHNDVLKRAARNYGLSLMENVAPAQRWGVSCGPWGTNCAAPDYADPVPGVTVALKNGWKLVPTCTAQDDTCPWQVNSIGRVRGQDRDYVLAVLTTGDPAGRDLYGFSYGITTIQGVSERVWDNLAPGSES